MPVGTPFIPKNQPDRRGRPKGRLSLDSRVRRIPEGQDKLPNAIAETIKKAVGDNQEGSRCQYTAKGLLDLGLVGRLATTSRKTAA